MSRKKYTSEEIIEGMMSGDNKIYRYLDTVYRKRVIKHVGENSGSREEGEDLYQEVMFEVFLNVEQGKYDPKRSGFGTYFMMISRNRWKDRLRDRKRSIQLGSLDDIIHKVGDKDEAEETENDLYNRLAHAMRQCIAQLAEDEQEMIHLFYFTKKKLRAIALEMGITYDYAKIKMYRIREKLRKKLKEMIGNDPDFEFVWV